MIALKIENIIGRTREVFEAVYKKADGAVSVSKQKLDIASLENKQQKDFERLGRIYYTELKKGETLAEGEAAELVEKIDEKEARLEEMRDELLRTQNKKTCPECGAAIHKNSVFCNICGVKFTEE